MTACVQQALAGDAQEMALGQAVGPLLLSQFEALAGNAAMQAQIDTWLAERRLVSMEQLAATEDKPNQNRYRFLAAQALGLISVFAQPVRGARS